MKEASVQPRFRREKGKAVENYLVALGVDAINRTVSHGKERNPLVTMKSLGRK